MIHRKTVRHFHEPGHLHELTFSCYQQMALLTDDAWREKLARCIDVAGDEASIELVGFVFMPEHVHLLVYPTTTNPPISRYLARIKQPFSKEVKDVLAGRHSSLLFRLTVQERPGKTCFRFWQEGSGFDRNLFSAEAVSLSLDYIHNNPVRRGSCRCAVDWEWSSARHYAGLAAIGNYGLPKIYALPEGATW